MWKGDSAMEAVFSSQQSEAAFGNQHSAISNQQSAISENQQQQQQKNQNRGPGSPELLRAEELVQKLGETYDELIRLMDQNPAVARQVTGTTANHEKADRRLKSRLELANATPRCRWIKQG